MKPSNGNPAAAERAGFARLEADQDLLRSRTLEPDLLDTIDALKAPREGGLSPHYHHHRARFPVLAAGIIRAAETNPTEDDRCGLMI